MQTELVAEERVILVEHAVDLPDGDVAVDEAAEVALAAVDG